MEPDFVAAWKTMPQRGWHSVSVPGCVSAWVEMHKRWGKLPFEKLFERAIRYGREGFLMSPTIAMQWDKQVPELKSSPGSLTRSCRTVALPNRGSASGSRRTPRCWNRSPRRKARPSIVAGSRRRVEAHAKQHGGAMRATDFAAHKTDWVEPLAMDYRGYTLHEIPPNGQGIVALKALGMLEHFDLRSHTVDGVDSVHLQIEAIKLAFADAWRYVADVDYMKEVRPSGLIDRQYLKERASSLIPSARRSSTRASRRRAAPSI